MDILQYNICMDNNIFSIFNNDPDTSNINDIYQEIVKKTSEIVSKWKDFIKQEEFQKSYKIMLDWQVELTNSLWHWVSLSDGIPIGDLILARINIGMLVETWLKVFFTIYSEDYRNDNSKIIINNKNEKIEFNDLNFDKLVNFFATKVDPRLSYKHCPIPDRFFELLEKVEIASFFQHRKNEIKDYRCFKEWLNKIRDTRNSVHSFTYRKIGTYKNFLEDVIKFNVFLDIIIRQLPSGISEDGELVR